MPVQIISQKEKLQRVIDGTTFFYRRITSGERSNVVRAHSKRGDITKADWGQIVNVMLRSCLLGWENLVDLDGEQVAFDPDIIEFLPDAVLTELSELIGASAGQEASAKKSKQEHKS